MKGYTLDTNIVTVYLKRNQLVSQRIRQATTAGHAVMLNAISYYEIKRRLLLQTSPESAKRPHTLLR